MYFKAINHNCHVNYNSQKKNIILNLLIDKKNFLLPEKDGLDNVATAGDAKTIRQNGASTAAGDEDEYELTEVCMLTSLPL